MAKRVTGSTSANEAECQLELNEGTLHKSGRKIRKRNINNNNVSKIAPASVICTKNIPMNGACSKYWHRNATKNTGSSDEETIPLTSSSYNDNHGGITMGKHGNTDSIKKLNTSSLNENVKDHNYKYNGSLIESPKPVYILRPSIVNGAILCDLQQNSWRLGRPIGKGNFGEIFLASDDITKPVTNENAKFVVKIEPHSNGPLFVEIHCLMNTAKKNYDELKQRGEAYEENAMKNIKKDGDDNDLVCGPPSGIPKYIASGSHKFDNGRYRFLVLPRFDRDLHSLIKNSCVNQKSLLTLAIHVINVLENLHNSGYCHNDVKAQNLMISKCKYLKLVRHDHSQQKQHHQGALKKSKKLSAANELKFKNTSIMDNYGYKDDTYEEKQQTTDSGNSSEQELRDCDCIHAGSGDNEHNKSSDFVLKRRIYNISESSTSEDDEDEDFDDGATNSISSSVDTYDRTSINRKETSHMEREPHHSYRHRLAKGQAIQKIEYSGSNPVRSCRRQKRRNSIYEEMVKSHYLRPAKRISYSEFFSEDYSSVNDLDDSSFKDFHSTNTSDDDDVSDNDDDSDEFRSRSKQRLPPKKSRRTSPSQLLFTRSAQRQEKLSLSNSVVKNKKIAQEPIIKTKGKSIIQYHQQHDYQDVEKSSTAIKPDFYYEEHEEEHIFLIDYGLASKYMDNGVHRPFVMDQRRAHDGTLEFTSRDAHMGAHSRRSDLECLGYNLLFWSQGYLPWKKAAIKQQPEKVHQAKEYLMLNVREILREIYGQHVPKYLGEFLYLVGQLSYNEKPDYERYRCLFQHEYKQLGYALDDMCLNINEIQRNCIQIRKSEIDNKMDFFSVTNKPDVVGGVQRSSLHIMNHLSICSTPLHERNLSNRVSPKNLRSKSNKKPSGKISWTEILSKDPDQIARERAEKEFEREEKLNSIRQQREPYKQHQQHVRKYQGNPTYAIKEILRRQSGRTFEDANSDKNIKQPQTPNNQQIKWYQQKVFLNNRLKISNLNMESTPEIYKKENSQQILKNAHNDFSTPTSCTNNDSSHNFTINKSFHTKVNRCNKMISPDASLDTPIPRQISTSMSITIENKGVTKCIPKKNE